VPSPAPLGARCEAAGRERRLEEEVRRAGRWGVRRRGADPIARTRNGCGGNRGEFGRGERGGAIGRLERLRRDAERARLRGEAFSLGQEPAATNSEARHVGGWRGGRGGRDAVGAGGPRWSHRGRPHRRHGGLRHGAAGALGGGDRRPGDRDERDEERDYKPLHEGFSEFLWIGRRIGDRCASPQHTPRPAFCAEAGPGFNPSGSAPSTGSSTL
jgi:hypothetical protein